MGVDGRAPYQPPPPWSRRLVDPAAATGLDQTRLRELPQHRLLPVPWPYRRRRPGATRAWRAAAAASPPARATSKTAAAAAATRRETRSAAPAPPCVAPAEGGRADRHRQRPPPTGATAQRVLHVPLRERTAVAAACLGKQDEPRWKGVDFLGAAAVGATKPAAAACGGFLGLGPR